MMKTRITRNVLTIVIAIALVVPTFLALAPRTEAATYVSTRRLNLVATAKKYLGRPYVFGSNNAPYSFDCSSFVQYVFRLYGIRLYRTAASQWYQGRAVSKANLRPGDVVFFTNTYKPGISHVGIYIGKGYIIHAWPNKGVEISPLSNSYLTQHYAGARNMFGD